MRNSNLKFLKHLLFLVLMVLSTVSIFANPQVEANRLFTLGNKAYEKGDFEEAEKQLRLAIDQGIADHRLYYNYADALFRQDKLGLSILWWEKAHKLNPDDADVESNLRFARARIMDKTPTPETNFMTKVLWAIHASYSINQGMWAIWILFTLALLGLFGWLRAAGLMRGLGATFFVLATLVLLILTPSLLYKIKLQESSQSAIVLKPVCEMYSGPGDTYQLLTRVHEGTKFNLVQQNGEWISVTLTNGKGGWVRLSDLGKI